jgi:integrase
MGRRSFGIVDKQRSGNFRARYTGPDGKRHPAPHTFLTRGAADTWLAQQQAAIASGTWEPPEVVKAKAVAAQKEAARKAVTLGEYASTWIATRTNSKGEHLRIRTRTEYERMLRAPGTKGTGDEGGPLAPLLDEMLGDITPEMVRSWRTEQLATGHKTQTARTYDLLKSIMKTAVEDELIDKNPCQITGGSATSTGKRVEPPTDDELEGILEAIDKRYVALVVLAGFGGLRFGEASELRAKDVAVEKSDTGEVVSVRVTVERQVVYVAGKGRSEGAVKAAASVRQVALFGEDARIVAEQVKGKIGNALLFTNKAGDSWLAQSAFYRHWDNARKAVGRGDMPLHALRHYAGTRYAQAGATVRETMARLGHSSERAAMRYQHAGNRDDELAMRVARGLSTGTDAVKGGG